MFSHFNKRTSQQYSLASYSLAFTAGRLKKYFFKLVGALYPFLYVRSEKPPAGKMLVISEVGGLGDAILFRRTLEGVRNRYDVNILTKAYHRPVYRNVVPANRLIEVDGSMGLFKVCRKLSRERIDILVLHEISIASFLATFFYFRRVPFKLGIFADEGAGFLNKTFRARDYKNVLDLYTDLTVYLGGTYRLYSFDEYRSLPKTNEILVHLGSGSLCKNWRIANFLELFRKLDDARLKYLVIGSNEDLAAVGKFTKAAGVRTVAVNSFEQLARLIAGSELVICHNTSVLHLAFALGIKTISFNSKSNYGWWNPYKDLPDHRHFAFKASDEECGYGQQIRSLLIEKNKYGCSLFDSIKPDEVLRVAKEMLGKNHD